LLLVLDSNEYIFSFGVYKKPSCEELIDRILAFSHSIRISQAIIKEVRRNLSIAAFKEFIEFVTSLTIIDEDIFVPFELGIKYELKGLKPADAFIAAYTEWVGADALVTENRHFLSRHKDLPFKVITAQTCLKSLVK
jgi:predicted nucleic acid-binding protein